MCDYCDCRSHAHIASLSADHEVLQVLLGDLARAASDDDRDAATAVTAALSVRLVCHAEREQRGVFRQLRSVVGGEYVRSFEDDHAELHRLLDDVAGDDWRRVAADLITALHRHILREESDLFPAAHQLLAPAQWDAIEAMPRDTTLTQSTGARP